MKIFVKELVPLFTKEGLGEITKNNPIYYKMFLE